MLSLLFSLIAASGSVNGAAHPRRGLDQLVTQCKHDFAYTFDDGPYIWHSEILDAFDAADSKTTFWFTGTLYSCIYDEDNVQRLRDTVKRGHMFGSHTWSHPHLPALSQDEIDVEIQRLDEAFVKILGLKPKFLRPPYGDMDDRTATYIQEKHGKTLVNWSDDSGDWQEGKTGQEIYNFYNNFASEDPKTSHLCLSHETVQPEIEAVRNGTVAALVNGGIKLITVGDCLDTTDIYEIVGQPGVRDETWTCEGDWTAPSSTTIRDTPTASETVTRSEVGGGDADPTVTRATPTVVQPTVTRTTAQPAPSCVAQYTSASGDTCTSIGSSWGIPGELILAANSFLNCNDIWTNTPICIPYPGTPCSQRINSGAGDTCDSIGAKYGVSGATILLWNHWLNCNDIWTGTSVCVSHRGIITGRQVDPTVTRVTPTVVQPTVTRTTAQPTPSCVAQYTSASGDTCTSIGSSWGIPGELILAANSFLNCNDIWTNTPICIPYPGTPCSQRINSGAGDTCDSIGAKYGVSGATILLWNHWLNCNDIWTGTSVCVAHRG